MLFYSIISFFFFFLNSILTFSFSHFLIHFLQFFFAFSIFNPFSFFLFVFLSFCNPPLYYSFFLSYWWPFFSPHKNAACVKWARLQAQFAELQLPFINARLLNFSSLVSGRFLLFSYMPILSLKFILHSYFRVNPFSFIWILNEFEFYASHFEIFLYLL